MFTQCPSCKTVFNVKPEQLGAAHGKVRCSRCQSIFNARENLYTPPSAPAAEEKAVAQKTTQPAPTAPAGTPTDTETKKPAAIEAKPTTTTAAVKAEPTPPAAPAPVKEPISPTIPETDDWFDLTPSPANKPKPAMEKKPAEKTPAPAKAALPPEEPPVSIEDELTEDLFKLFDEPAAEIAEPEKVEITEAKTELQPSEEPPTTPDRSKADTEKEAKKKERSTDEGSGTEKKGKKVTPGSYSLPPQLESRPVRATMRTLFYGVSILMLVAALVIQYGYNQRIPLRENETLRPWLDALCQLTNCPMPPKRDPSKIELVDNMMQSHPRYQHSLLVTATLINRADYAQPYPIVEITMTDLQQRVVARRTFRPEEYLAGDFAGMSFTPNVEVPLMLELSDPGDKAVGFKFDFY